MTLLPRQVLNAGGANHDDQPFGAPILAHHKLLLIGPLLLLAGASAWVLLMIGTITVLRWVSGGKRTTHARVSAMENTLSRARAIPVPGRAPSGRRRRPQNNVQSYVRSPLESVGEEPWSAYTEKAAHDGSSGALLPPTATTRALAYTPSASSLGSYSNKPRPSPVTLPTLTRNHNPTSLSSSCGDDASPTVSSVPISGQNSSGSSGDKPAEKPSLLARIRPTKGQNNGQKQSSRILSVITGSGGGVGGGGGGAGDMNRSNSLGRGVDLVRSRSSRRGRNQPTGAQQQRDIQVSPAHAHQPPVVEEQLQGSATIATNPVSRMTLAPALRLDTQGTATVPIIATNPAQLRPASSLGLQHQPQQSYQPSSPSSHKSSRTQPHPNTFNTASSPTAPPPGTRNIPLMRSFSPSGSPGGSRPHSRLSATPSSFDTPPSTPRPTDRQGTSPTTLFMVTNTPPGAAQR